MVSPAAMAQRPVSAKAKICDASPRSEEPGSCELPARIGTVLEWIYGAYTRGANTAVLGPEAVQPSTFVGLRAEALYLCRLVVKAAARPRRGTATVGTDAALRGTTIGADRRSRTLPSAVCAAASTRFVPARISHPFSALQQCFHRSDASVSDRQTAWSGGCRSRIAARPGAGPPPRACELTCRLLHQPHSRSDPTRSHGRVCASCLCR